MRYRRGAVSSLRVASRKRREPEKVRYIAKQVDMGHALHLQLCTRSTGNTVRKEISLLLLLLLFKFSNIYYIN